MHNEPLLDRDPGAYIGLLGTAVTSILALLVSFGINLSPDQQAAILGVLAGVGPLAAALLVRTKAYAPVTVKHEIADALAASHIPRI